MKTKGFTLVELLVVIAILAILATVSVVGYTQYIDGANQRVVEDALTKAKNDAINYDIAFGNKDGIVDEDEALAAVKSVFGADYAEVDGLTVTEVTTTTGTGENAVTTVTGVSAVTYTKGNATATWTVADGTIE